MSDSTKPSRPAEANNEHILWNPYSRVGDGHSDRSSKTSDLPSGYLYLTRAVAGYERGGESLLSVVASELKLPMRLPKPESLVSVDLESIHLPPSLAALPPPFVLSKLSSLGPSLLVASSRSIVLYRSSATAMPSFVKVRPPPEETDLEGLPTDLLLPTHVFAIKGRRSDSALMLPVHGLVYAVNCHAFKHLLAGVSTMTTIVADDPPLPTSPQSPDSKFSSPSSPSEAVLNLPVVQVYLPNGSTFNLLHRFLTCPSLPHLLGSLLPLPPSSVLPTLYNNVPGSTLQALACHLASTVDSGTLVERLDSMHGLWEDVVSLGVANEDLWEGLQMAWAILVGALAMGEGTE